MLRLQVRDNDDDVPSCCFSNLIGSAGSCVNCVANTGLMVSTVNVCHMGNATQEENLLSSPPTRTRLLPPKQLTLPTRTTCWSSQSRVDQIGLTELQQEDERRRSAVIGAGERWVEPCVRRR